MSTLKIVFSLCLLRIIRIHAEDGNMHFASISWARNATVGPFGVTFRIKSILNRRYGNILYCGTTAYQVTGSTVPTCITAITLLGGQDGTPRFTFLDTNTSEFPLTITASNLSSADDPRLWVVGYFEISKNYSGPGPWQVEFSGCCMAKSPQLPFSLKATVNLMNSDHSPSIAILPSITVPSGQHSWVAANGHGGAQMRWSLDRNVTFSGTLGPGITIAPSTGLLSVPLGVSGSAYISTSVFIGEGPFQSSSSVIFILDAPSSNSSFSPLAGPPTPAPLSQPFGSSVPLVLDYVFYTGFPLKVVIPLIAIPAGGLMVANSDLDSCCLPLHSSQALNALPFSNGALTPTSLSFDVSAAAGSPVLTLAWNRPCHGEVGSSVLCVAVADATSPGNVSSLPLCLRLTVMENPAPLFILPVEKELVWSMGRLGRIDVLVRDSASEDTVASLGLLSNTSLPEGATFGPAALDGPAASAALEWVPLAGAGGGAFPICFGATDRKVSPYDKCVTGQRASHYCLTIHVVRCRYVARPRESIMDVAYLFQTDWIQLWALNPEVTQPDYGVGDEVDTLNTGHLYAVQSGDYLAAIAYKMGVTVKSLLLHNADLGQDGSDQDLPVGKLICVMPSSCRREG